jgi:NAD(P)-dependent dehydrogenase (short-subunit alcohol dehydrogenase family)
MKKPKTIIITGANRGIGLQAAKDLSQDGHLVIMTSRDLQKGVEASKSVSGEPIVHQLDVTDSESITDFVKFIEDDVTRIDVLINNAGSVFDDMSLKSDNPLTTSLETLKKTFDLNFFGVYELTQKLIPFFDNENRSDVINISSGMGSLTEMGSGAPAYRFSKTALNSLTVFLGNNLAFQNIHVNSVCPGWVRTDLGGPNASRDIEESTEAIKYIVNEEPDINSQFIRDRELIAF